MQIKPDPYLSPWTINNLEWTKQLSVSKSNHEPTRQEHRRTFETLVRLFCCIFLKQEQRQTNAITSKYKASPQQSQQQRKPTASWRRILSNIISPELIASIHRKLKMQHPNNQTLKLF